MKRAQRGTLGFTLLELLIVIIIIGILAAVALPQFAKLMRRSRLAEPKAICDALATGELAYYQEFNKFVAIASHGAASTDLKVDIADASRTPWDYSVTTGTDSTLAACFISGVTDGSVTANTGMAVTYTLRSDGSRSTSEVF